MTLVHPIKGTGAKQHRKMLHRQSCLNALECVKQSKYPDQHGCSLPKRYERH